MTWISTVITVGFIILAILFILFFISLINLSSTKGIEKELTRMGTAVASAQNNILQNNADIMKQSANINADIHKDAIRTTMKAVKDGLTDTDTMHCKHCRSSYRF